ncbi:hypothetical protein [Curtobacterium sp. MCPF17_052]|uniref:hypothetical protein n=1 Tax=Curtobacterium sp. MCPF17_052 TaxID=2175655 RepID=UPI000DA6FBB0|nr:hypothetical protein [Curtobacterium sp. MCPF17_052]WIB13316.1 hypothetical protein DEJ36_05580 [Curtobacterium sp. MCPF17_052]
MLERDGVVGRDGRGGPDRLVVLGLRRQVQDLLDPAERAERLLQSVSGQAVPMTRVLRAASTTSLAMTAIGA